MNDMILWSPGVTLEHIEKQVILKAYKHYRENKTITANALGIAVRTLDNKLEKYAEDKLAEEKQLSEIRKREEDYKRRARGLASPETLPIGHETQTGVRVESVVELSAQQPVPMPERQEVQTMPPKRSPSTRTRGSGKEF